MQHARPLVVLSLAVLCFASGAAAAPAPHDPKGQMDEIFFLSGLEEQLRILSDGLGAGLAPHIQQLPAPQAQALERAILREFSRDALQRAVEARLERAYDARNASAVLIWLRSPLGRRISKLEIAASGADAAREMQSYAQLIQTESGAPPAARVALIASLEEATGMSDFTVDLSLTSALATALGVNGALPVEHRADEDEIRAGIEAQRPMLRAQIQQVTQIAMLYSYRSLSDPELRDYVAFASGGPGQWYHGVVKSALLDAIVRASLRVGESVATDLREMPSPLPASPAQ